MSFSMGLIKKNIELSTHVTFPWRSTKERSKVVDIANLINGKIALFLEKTPFHPVDRRWPDQPADRGILIFKEDKFRVEDCLSFAVHKQTKEIKQSEQILKAEKQDWFSVVGHVIDPGSTPYDFLIGLDVDAEVEESYRHQLSLHHTASHLAAFALNYATKEFWAKDAPLDTLGSPNFDQLAIETSFIHPDCSEDRYRLGKSIKKQGLDVNRLFENLPQIDKTVNVLLKEWLLRSSDIQILTEGPQLDATRIWKCNLPLGDAEMHCGGTHVPSLSSFTDIQYSIIVDENKDEKKFLARTVAK